MLGLLDFNFQISKLPSSNHQIIKSSNYSVRNDFTGLATAAFIAWKLTVINAIIIAKIPAIKNIYQLMVTL